jgi:hypothetical protein
MCFENLGVVCWKMWKFKVELGSICSRDSMALGWDSTTDVSTRKKVNDMSHSIKENLLISQDLRLGTGSQNSVLLHDRCRKNYEARLCLMWM